MQTNIPGLEKDNNSGAIILAPSYKKENFQLDLLAKKLNVVYEQNTAIYELLLKIAKSLNISNEDKS